MSKLSRMQLNAIMTAAALVSSGAAPYTPPLSIGQNAPGDSSVGTLMMLNDRAYLSQNFYTTNLASLLPVANQDPATGLPTTAFAFKLAQGALQSSPVINGTWVVLYDAPAQLTLSNAASAPSFTFVSHTFSGGHGVYQFSISNAQNVPQPLGLNFSGPVTSMNVYHPAAAAYYLAGQPVPFWNDQYIRTTHPYTYFRLMDISGVNGDFITHDTNGGPTGWVYDTVEWAYRRTPSNFYQGYYGGLNGGYFCGWPLEWQIDLCNTAGKEGWFHVPETASDDYVTKMWTLIAQTYSSTRIAMGAVGNEDWNSGSSGILCYRKSGYMGMVEALAYQSAPTTEYLKPISNYAKTFSSDGTTATVVFNAAHGATEGNYPIVRKLNTGYTGFAPTSTGTIHVVDSMTISYHCTQVSTGGTVAASTVMAATGFIALNGNSSLFGPARNFVGDLYGFRLIWHVRRAMQVAALAKAAFVAAGRSADDCQFVLELQANTPYAFGNQSIEQYLAAAFPGVAFNSRFKAVAVGGYLTLSQGQAANPGFGLTGTNLTPVTSADVLTQLQQLADIGYGCGQYQALVAWARQLGVEAWGYEIGMDTVGNGQGETATQITNKATANADPAMRGLIKEWLQWFATLGFTRIGYYQCGAGDFASYGCFNLGRTPDEIDYTTPRANQSPKFQGIVDAQGARSTPQSYHAFPCTLSGYDVVGNEAVKITNSSVWPTLSGTNLPYGNESFAGSAGDGQTWSVWSEINQTATCTMVGDYTVLAAQTLTVAMLNGASGTINVPSGAGTNVTLGSCQIALKPGMNYGLIRSPSRASTTTVRSVAFS